MDALLSVRNVKRSFAVPRTLAETVRGVPERRLVAVDDVSFDVGRREVLGLVGESGSGKTTIARCLVRLYDPDSGTAMFDGQDLFAARGERLRVLRRRMQLIYQDPYSSLDPLMRVGAAIGEPARVHRLVAGGRAERQLVEELLVSVGLRPGDGQRYPRELSGGQRQRVAIARALAADPELIIADEAVSALDVSVQAQILNLFADLAEKRQLAMIFVSHQLAVIAQLSQRVAIMYLGRFVEIGNTREVFTAPGHPYTRLLLDAHPVGDTAARNRRPSAHGEMLSLVEIGTGCRFRNRCPRAIKLCSEADPPPVSLGNGHQAWCHLATSPAAGGLPAVDPKVIVDDTAGPKRPVRVDAASSVGRQGR
jgi:oligopeptide transport system ATP-binding protein